MVMVKDEKEVPMGGMVLLNNELGRIESYHEGKMNVRIVANNELHSVPASELTAADQKEMEKYKQSESKDVLLNQARELKKQLMEYDLWLEVKNASEAQVKQYKEEKEKAAAAANIGPSGNIVTEAKRDLEVDKEGEAAYKAGQTAAEREYQKSPQGQPERHEQVAAGMAGITQKQGERTPETAQEKQDAEERERQRKEREAQERNPK